MGKNIFTLKIPPKKVFQIPHNLFNYLEIDVETLVGEALYFLAIFPNLLFSWIFYVKALFFALPFVLSFLFPKLIISQNVIGYSGVPTLYIYIYTDRCIDSNAL